MRIDKYLKLSRIIKRRVIAKEVCKSGRVFINNAQAEPSSVVNVGDKVRVDFTSGSICIRVLLLEEVIRTKSDSTKMYRIISNGLEDSFNNI